MGRLDKLTALVIEDQYLIALDLEGHLQGLGFGAVRLTGSAVEAMAVAQAEPVAVALLDLGLTEPGESEALARWLTGRGIPFVIVTGFADTFDHGHPLHGVPVVRKPFGIGQLEAAIAAVLEGRRKASA